MEGNLNAGDGSVVRIIDVRGIGADWRGAVTDLARQQPRLFIEIELLDAAARGRAFDDLQRTIVNGGFGEPGPPVAEFLLDLRRERKLGVNACAFQLPARQRVK